MQKLNDIQTHKKKHSLFCTIYKFVCKVYNNISVY